MFFVFSGEGGPTDLGRCSDGTVDHCEGEAYRHGPMTVIVDQIVKDRYGYSLLETGCYSYISKHALVTRALTLKRSPRSPRLPGRKKPKETTYFYRNARSLACFAREVEAQTGGEVVAVLFRDSDGAASAGRGMWADKRDSMIAGFNDEDYPRGIPMVPKPKSEAWILCALKENPYQGCASLEDKSGNDKSPKSLKRELTNAYGHLPSGQELINLLESRQIDIRRIDMPSFDAFLENIEEAFG